MSRKNDLSRLDGSEPSLWLKILIFILTAGLSFGLFYLVQLWLFK